mmetsp:Transcript_8740/g.12417  ORF Transcript_8740/g.12417 Transcript_8740/m.12417 type:complete len:862 (-) Transcript_8740:44-2629(-)
MGFRDRRSFSNLHNDPEDELSSPNNNKIHNGRSPSSRHKKDPHLNPLQTVNSSTTVSYKMSHNSPKSSSKLNYSGIPASQHTNRSNDIAVSPSFNSAISSSINSRINPIPPSPSRGRHPTTRRSQKLTASSNNNNQHIKSSSWRSSSSSKGSHTSTHTASKYSSGSVISSPSKSSSASILSEDNHPNHGLTYSNTSSNSNNSNADSDSNSNSNILSNPHKSPKNDNQFTQQRTDLNLNNLNNQNQSHTPNKNVSQSPSHHSNHSNHNGHSSSSSSLSSNNDNQNFLFTNESPSKTTPTSPKPKIPSESLSSPTQSRLRDTQSLQQMQTTPNRSSSSDTSTNNPTNVSTIANTPNITKKYDQEKSNQYITPNTSTPQKNQTGTQDPPINNNNKSPREKSKSPREKSKSSPKNKKSPISIKANSKSILFQNSTSDKEEQFEYAPKCSSYLSQLSNMNSNKSPKIKNKEKKRFSNKTNAVREAIQKPLSYMCGAALFLVDGVGDAMESCVVKGTDTLANQNCGPDMTKQANFCQSNIHQYQNSNQLNTSQHQHHTDKNQKRHNDSSAASIRSALTIDTMDQEDLEDEMYRLERMTSWNTMATASTYASDDAEDRYDSINMLNVSNKTNENNFDANKLIGNDDDNTNNNSKAINLSAHGDGDLNNDTADTTMTSNREDVEKSNANLAEGNNEKESTAPTQVTPKSSLKSKSRFDGNAKVKNSPKVQFEYPPISALRECPRLTEEECKQLFFTEEELDTYDRDRREIISDDVEMVAVVEKNVAEKINGRKNEGTTTKSNQKKEINSKKRSGFNHSTKDNSKGNSGNSSVVDTEENESQSSTNTSRHDSSSKLKGVQIYLRQRSQKK